MESRSCRCVEHVVPDFVLVHGSVRLQIEFVELDGPGGSHLAVEALPERGSEKRLQKTIRSVAEKFQKLSQKPFIARLLVSF